MDQSLSGCRRSRCWGRMVLFAIAMPILLSGCVVSRHPAGIASATSPLTADYIVLGPVEGSSCRSWLLGVPLGGIRSTQAIIDELVKEKGADALVGVTVEYRGEVFALPIVGASCVNVKGQAVRGEK